ncbi:MAG: FtsQ-type POTRA domain-containing protein [Selenomonadaceae bacterium]|nr:FtsQ-type POTRA domain-containing protein [Selenomonadaceae bacterium]MBR4694890.1 FtsQ-type POTRA domain-containing protein [Selenomonadaceae bacterium]
MDGKSDEQKRSPRRMRNGILLMLLTAAVLGIVVYSPIFTLRDIRVEGTTYLTKEDIMRIAGLYRGEPLFQLQTDVVMKRLMQDLRVEEAVVRRSLPDKLDMIIKERKPVAIVACEYGYLDLDRQGKIIDGYRSLKSMAIPLITGITLHDVYIGDDVADPTVKTILYFLQQIDEESLNQISEISIQSPDYLVAYTVHSVQIRLGRMERLEEKAELTMNFLQDLKTSPHAIEYVDFNYTAPYIKLAQ